MGLAQTTNPIVQGALAAPDYQRRRVKWYPLNESDLRVLVTTEAFTAIFIALGSFSAGTWVSVQVGLALITGQQPPSTPVLQHVFLPLTAGGAIVFFVLALVSTVLRLLTVR
ncbi:MAG: hypothetical protein WCB51_06405, partial [Candidatus Dormiibacterota bacterium]